MKRAFALRCAGVAVAALIALSAAPPAFARIKLTTLPARDRVEIELDNAAATLVEEERTVTLLEGPNAVDFSWVNTQIDKGTIQFRVVNMPTRAKAAGDPASIVRGDGAVETIRVVSVAYPPGENALTWDVFSEKPFAARVRISYIIRNVTRSFEYRAVVEDDESTLTLSDYIKLANLSGEEFGESGLFAGFGNLFEREIGANEAKEMLLWKFAAVPVRKTFTFDWYEGQPVPGEPDQRYVSMRYVLVNDKAHAMGLFPLEPGKARIFQADGHGGEAFIGEDRGAMTGVGGEMKLYLGLARDVTVKRKIARNDRRAVAGNVFDQDVVIEYSISNFKADKLTLDIQEDVGRLRDELCGAKDHYPEWRIVPDGTTVGEAAVERKDSRIVEFHVPLDAAPKGDGEVSPVTVTAHLVLKNEW